MSLLWRQFDSKVLLGSQKMRTHVTIEWTYCMIFILCLYCASEIYLRRSLELHTEQKTSQHLKRDEVLAPKYAVLFYNNDRTTKQFTTISGAINLSWSSSFSPFATNYQSLQAPHIQQPRKDAILLRYWVLLQHSLIKFGSTRLYTFVLNLACERNLRN